MTRDRGRATRARLTLTSVGVAVLLAACGTSEPSEPDDGAAAPSADAAPESDHLACHLMSDAAVAKVLGEGELTRAEESSSDPSTAQTELGCTVAAASGPAIVLRASRGATRAPIDDLSCEGGREVRVEGVTALQCDGEAGPQIRAAWPTAADGSYTASVTLTGPIDAESAEALPAVMADVAKRLVTSDFEPDSSDRSSCSVIDDAVIENLLGSKPAGSSGSDLDADLGHVDRHRCTIDVSPTLMVVAAWRPVDPHRSGQLQDAGCFQTRPLPGSDAITCIRQPEDGTGGHVVAEGLWGKHFVSVAVHRTGGPQPGDRETAGRLGTHINERMADR